MDNEERNRLQTELKQKLVNVMESVLCEYLVEKASTGDRDLEVFYGIAERVVVEIFNDCAITEFEDSDGNRYS